MPMVVVVEPVAWQVVWRPSAPCGENSHGRSGTAPKTAPMAGDCRDHAGHRRGRIHRGRTEQDSRGHARPGHRHRLGRAHRHETGTRRRTSPPVASSPRCESTHARSLTSISSCPASRRFARPSMTSPPRRLLSTMPRLALRTGTTPQPQQDHQGHLRPRSVNGWPRALDKAGPPGRAVGVLSPLRWEPVRRPLTVTGCSVVGRGPVPGQPQARPSTPPRAPRHLPAHQPAPPGL